MNAVKMSRWDRYFIDIARAVSVKSKDPSSKIGVVIIGHDRQILTTGFNGHARGIDENLPERWERPLKYDYVVHAEINAICNAARSGTALLGSTLYLIGMGPPTAPCIGCAKAIIQSGIKDVRAFAYKTPTKGWESSLELGLSMLSEAGVAFYELED